MNLSLMGWAGALAGLAALGAVLFALQRLQVRHRDVVVPTTLFWREAVDQARARVLFQRFRHPWAYALACAIAACLWLAFAGPSLAGDRSADHVVLVDGSAAAARAGRWEAIQAALDRELDGLPADRTVILCGSAPRVVLGPGEHPELLRSRLAARGPEATPPSFAREIARLGAERRTRPLVVTCVGDLAPGIAAPDGVDVRHVLPEGRSAGNAGIVALGVRAPTSGAVGCVDVLVATAGVDAADSVRAGERGALVATVDGAPIAQSFERLPQDGDRDRFALRDVPARGGRLEVVLQPAGPDDLDLDDRAALRLPDRQPIRVAVGEGVPASLVTALAVDPEIEIAEPGAGFDLRVGLAGAMPVGAGPELVLVSSATAEHAFALVAESAGPADGALRDAVAALGLDQLDGAALAEEAQRPVTVGLEAPPAGSGGVRALRLWQTLFSEDFEFARTRALPVLVGRGVRWLVGRPPIVPYAAVGEPLPGERDGRFAGAWADGTGRLVDPVGGRFAPAVAGAYEGSEVAVEAALTSAAVTAPAAPEDDVVTAAEASGGSGDAVTWLALLALALLAGEWFLYRSGRMP